MATMQVEHKGQVVASVKNHTPNIMECERYINYTDTPTVGTLPPIPPHGDLKLVDLVSKGAAIYYSHDKLRGQVAWVVAWNSRPIGAPIPTTMKVYVTCGPKKAIDEMTPEQIETNLFKSSDVSGATDSITKAVADARISVILGGAAASVAANFGFLVTEN